MESPRVVRLTADSKRGETTHKNYTVSFPIGQGLVEEIENAPKRKNKKDPPGPENRKKASPRTGKPASKKPSAVWDQAAQWYDALVGLKGSEYQKAIIFPVRCN